MLHACYFGEDEDDAGLLVDVPNEAAAREAFRQETGGDPVRVVALPPGCGWRFGWVEDEDEPDTDVLEFIPLDHVVDVFAALEDAAPEVLELPIAAAPVLCTATAYGPKDEDLRCERTEHSATEKHRCGAFQW